MSSAKFSHLRPATMLFAVLSVICGVVYPLVVCGVVSVLFPVKAGGSMVEVRGKAVGSTLIGQAFTSPKYFWSRPSATTPMPANGAGSGGANLGTNNPAQIDAVKGRIDALRAAEAAVGLAPSSAAIPVDLVTASASGLDPEISMAAALYQAPRIAAARHLDSARVRSLIDANRQPQYFGFFGEPRVNVLALNLALDGETPVLVQAQR